MSEIMSCLRFEKIWIYSESIDFRKQINGLVEMVMESEKQPDDGSIYIFRNRQRNRIKLLLWDRNGYFMGLKRLERGKFDFPENRSGTIGVTKEEMMDLISGMPMLRYESLKKPLFHH